MSDELEVVFDTVERTRKYRNLRVDPRIALVIGWDDEITAGACVTRAEAATS